MRRHEVHERESEKEDKEIAEETRSSERGNEEIRLLKIGLILLKLLEVHLGLEQGHYRVVRE